MLSKCVTAGSLTFAIMNASCAIAQQAPAAAAVEQQPSFEVATIKPSRPENGDRNWDDSSGRLSIEGYTLRQIVKVAYGLKSDSQVLGGPKWIETDRFDIVAKADDAETLKMQSMNRKQWGKERSLMLQSLLADRFQLKVSPGVRTIPVDALVARKSESKLTPSSSEEKNHSLSVHNGAMTATAISMDSLADFLSTQFEIGDRVVVNRTGLTGDYDFKLNWTSDRGNGIPPDAAYPGLFTALQEQLGLKLESQKGSVEVVIVDAASEPTFD